jgi:hypothetical protein
MEGLGPNATEAELWAEIYRLRAAVAGPKGYESWQDAATGERMWRVRKSQQIETLLRGINDARQLIDPIWRERMGAESVREYVQRGLRCIDSAITDCQFTGNDNAGRCVKCGLPPGCPDCRAVHDVGLGA